MELSQQEHDEGQVRTWLSLDEIEREPLPLDALLRRCVRVRLIDTFELTGEGVELVQQHRRFTLGSDQVRTFAATAMRYAAWSYAHTAAAGRSWH